MLSSSLKRAVPRQKRRQDRNARDGKRNRTRAVAVIEVVMNRHSNVSQNPRLKSERHPLTSVIRRASRALAVLAGSALLPACVMANHYDEAEVLSAEPIYRTVAYSVPAERCHDEEIAYQDAPRGRSATPTILGAVIGGAIGHAVGHEKRNKQVGTAVGALLGGTIGNDIGRRRAAYDGAVRYRTERVCQTVDEVREQEELAGYDVAYRYGGQVYHTQTQHHPGDTLRVNVRVDPAE